MINKNVILLVEDNDDDAELTVRAFQQAKIRNPIIRVYDGTEALDYLLSRGEHAARKTGYLPAVVLLDIKLPGLSGLEVLKAIRSDERTRNLPVVMLTSSAQDADRLAAYDMGVNSYVQKPVDYDQFVKAARRLGLYWMVVNRPAPTS